MTEPLKSITQQKYISSCFDAIAFFAGRLMSGLLALGHTIFGSLIDSHISTPLQRILFVTLARINAPGTTVLCLLMTSLYAYAEAQSGLATALLLVNLLPIQSMYYRLAAPGKASLLVTSCYGRELRVHLPSPNLTARDVARLKQQVLELVHIARSCDAKTVTFDSPLLTAYTTSARLVASLNAAGLVLNTKFLVTVDEPREVDVLSDGNLSINVPAYNRLRIGRLTYGKHGRLMSRKIRLSFIQSVCVVEHADS